jgi:hypothetical protein
MIPKEMASDLYHKFYDTTQHPNSVKIRDEIAKKAAIICVDEILRACNQVYDSDMVHFRETATGEWWLAVIAEIKKI